MTARYAQTTGVPVEKTRNEIEQVLRRYGATAFVYAWSNSDGQIAFEVAGRRVIMRLPLPDRRDKRFTHTPGRKLLRHVDDQERAYEQACRQSWRALLLIIKAKLEAVAAGITTVEQEFLAHIALPNGSTVGEWMAPQLAVAYESNAMPALMPGGQR